MFICASASRGYSADRSQATFAKTYSQSVAYAAVPILFLFAGSFVVWLFPLPFLCEHESSAYLPSSPHRFPY